MQSEVKTENSRKRKIKKKNHIFICCRLIRHFELIWFDIDVCLLLWDHVKQSAEQTFLLNRIVIRILLVLSVLANYLPNTLSDDEYKMDGETLFLKQVNTYIHFLLQHCVIPFREPYWALTESIPCSILFHFRFGFYRFLLFYSFPFIYDQTQNVCLAQSSHLEQSHTHTQNLKQSNDECTHKHKTEFKRTIDE